MELALKLIITASLSHAQWYGSTLFFDHGEMLQVFICVKKEFASVKLYKNAGHGPNITLLIPGVIFKYDLRCSILSCVNYEGVTFMFVRRPTKVNDFYFT